MNVTAATGVQRWIKHADRDRCFPPLVSATWMLPSERRNSNCPLSGSLKLPCSAKGFLLRSLQWHDTSSAILILRIQPQSAILLPSALGMQRYSPAGATRASIRNCKKCTGTVSISGRIMISCKGQYRYCRGKNC